MRELERIDRIINKINILWKLHFDQRLMQLMINYILPRIKTDNKYFYLEDDDIETQINIITRMLMKVKKERNE